MNFLKKNTIFKVLTLFLSIGLLFAIMGCTDAEDPDDTIPATDDTVLVTGITLTSAGSATTISTHLGTLQLTAAVTPAGATNKLVTWSVTDGTGSATINQSGLLSAVANGTVTVKVVSQSVTSVSAELIIEISNQVTDNTEPLATAIAEANQNKMNTMVGTDSDDYVPSVEFVLAADQTAYVNAITAAQLILDGAPLTDTEVSDAVDDLVAATTLFNSKKADGTKVVASINLGTAENFAILSKTGIATTGSTSVIGDMGISPAVASYITGFGLIMDSSNEFSTSSLVTGQIFAADYLVGTPVLLTTAIGDMQTAYNDGQGRTADYIELHTGDLSGKTLSSAVYKWSNSVLINTDLTLDGSATDVFIFQIAGGITMAANTKITLTGGLLPENIFWVVADTVAIGVGSDFQGIILAMTNVSMNTGSTIQGMIYAQTSVSLDATVVTKP